MKAWMLKTGVMDPREAVMCSQDTVNYSSDQSVRFDNDGGPAIVTRIWFEHKPELRAEVQAVVDHMRAEIAGGSLDGGCCHPMLVKYVAKLEAALKP